MSDQMPKPTLGRNSPEEIINVTDSDNEHPYSLKYVLPVPPQNMRRPPIVPDDEDAGIEDESSDESGDINPRVIIPQTVSFIFEVLYKHFFTAGYEESCLSCEKGYSTSPR